MLGNPFGTAFDLDGLTMPEGSGVLGASVAVWDPGVGAAGSYRTVTRTGDPASGDDLISVWQGLFALVSNVEAPATPPTFAYDIAAARGDAPLRAKRTEATTPHRLDLRLDATIQGLAVADVAASVLATPDGSLGWDAYDFPKLAPLGSPSATVAIVGVGSDGESVAKALESLPSSLPEPLRLPLRITASHAGTLTLSWPTDTLPPTWTLMLEDRHEGRDYDPRADASISFTLAEAGATERFVLHITPLPVSNESLTDALPALSLAAPWPNPASGSARLTVRSTDAGPVHVTLFDTLGRCVRTLHDGVLSLDEQHPIIIPSDLAAGLYVIRARAGTRYAIQSFVKL